MAVGCGSAPIGDPPYSSPEAPGMSLGARHDGPPGLSGEGQTTAAIASNNLIPCQAAGRRA